MTMKKNLLCKATVYTAIVIGDSEFHFSEDIECGQVIKLTEAEFDGMYWTGLYRGDEISIKADDYEIEEDTELTYEELMALAKEHYNEGGDQTYECCDERWYNDYTEMFGRMTKADALIMFRLDDSRRREIEATAW